MHRHRRRPDIPARPAPIAQPEDAGLRIGRMLHRVADLYLLTAMEHGTLDCLAIAHCPLIKRERYSPMRRRPLTERARSSPSGDPPAIAHSLGETRYVGDPTIDGALSNIEQFGQP